MTTDFRRPAALHYLTRRRLLQAASSAALVAGTAPFGRAVAQPMSHYDLKVEMANVDGQAFDLRTYNKMTPGPTMVVDPGGVLSVRLDNALDAQSPDEVCTDDHNRFHGANVTNFHTHGLHVSPNVSSTGLDSDNIFLQIVPPDQEVPCTDPNIRIGGTDFAFELPDTHPSGTFWYHAHKHGSTAQQVAGGMAGPLIVRDKPGVMPSYIANAPEDIFMIQLRDLTDDAPNPRNSGGRPMIVQAFPGGDGIKNPTIVLAPGEVRRWRFINATPRADAFVTLNFPKSASAPELWQIAFDGLTLDRRVPVDPENTGDPWDNHAALAPGNRTDFMIRVPRDAPQGEVVLSANMVAASVLHDVADLAPPAQLLASTPVGLDIVISGEPVDDEWSTDDTLPGSGLTPIDPDAQVPEKTAAFEIAGGQFMIDGEEFSHMVQKQMKLGTVERWTLKNLNSFTHPFHIHVNPFFVTHVNGAKLADNDPRRRWQDTIGLPVAAGGQPGTITMMSRFETFTGKFVIHCHILDHEDQGMMQTVEVVA